MHVVDHRVLSECLLKLIRRSELQRELLQLLALNQEEYDKFLEAFADSPERKDFYKKIFGRVHRALELSKEANDLIPEIERLVKEVCGTFKIKMN